jgi:hypothetical protein
MLTCGIIPGIADERFTASDRFISGTGYQPVDFVQSEDTGW